MTSRTILNIDTGNRTINPRSGSSVYVDLVSNQTIGGIKRFLNNLITNSDVNFNTTANVGRIIFNSNEPAGSGSQIVAIYTEDENDGQGWIFDSSGNLYYLGGGLSPVKIMLSGATGDLTILSNFNGFGDVICHNILTSNIISSYSGGDITFNNGIALGSNTINSGDITSNGNISGGIITGTTSLITNLINASTGTIKNLIQMDNRFIDTVTGSVDIKSTYVGFPNLSQTLTTASNYMYIKPLTTGDFEMRILNKTKFTLKTDIALDAIASQIAWAWMDESNIIHASINPNTTASTTNNAVCKFYARVVDTSLYYTRNGTLGSQNETSLNIIWRIDDSGNIFTSGTVYANTINPNSGTAIASASIWNFKDATNTTNITLNPTATSGYRLQITGVSAGTTFLYYNTSNVLAVFNSITGANVWSIDGTTGNINTIGSVLTNTINPNSGTTISSTSIWNFKNGANIPILLDPTTTSGNRLKIDSVIGGTRYLFFNTSSIIGVFNTATGANVWSIDGVTGDINTIGTLTYATLSATSLSTNTISPISPSTTININTTSNFNWLKSVGVNRIKFFPSSISGDIMRIFRSGDDDANFGYWYFNNNGEFGFSFNGATVWSVFVTGNMRTTNTIQAPIFSALTAYTYTNRIQMENLFYNASIASIDMRSQYIGFAHPNQALSILSKYGAIVTAVGGDLGFTINNISGYVWGTDWANRIMYTDYTFQCQKSSFVVNYRYQKFMNNLTEIGSISMLTASSIAFNSTSDYRLKQDIKPLEKSLERLMKLQPKSYRFIKDVEDECCCNCYFDGFLAHEVSDIIPMAVSGVKDDPDNFQQMDYSKLTPLLTGAVQELNEKVDKMQLIIDSQQKMIEMLLGRLDNFYKESSSLATSDNVISGGTSGGDETSGTTSTCDAETSTCGSTSDF